METDIALIATGYVLARLAAIAAFGYLIYRVLRPSPSRPRARSQGQYARERLVVTRRQG